MASRPDGPGFDLSPPGCLALLWPRLPETLIAPPVRQALESAAAALPPIPAIALEIRLDGDDTAIDLHQLISRDAGDAPALLRFLDGDGDGAAALATDPLRRFLRDWALGAQRLRYQVSEIYLEWDRPDATVATTPPGIFLRVDPGRGLDADLDEADLLAIAARLHAMGSGAAADAIRRVQAALPIGTTISFVGFMLGRDVLRLNLRQLRPAAFAAVMAAIGWPGDIAVAERHFADLVARCDRVVVALDFAPGLRASIGFELFFDAGPAAEPRYAMLLDHLVEQQLCAPALRDRLVDLDYGVLPETPGQSWPAAWLVAAATGPSTFLPCARLRVSHLKLSLAENGRASAKAYISSRHHWLRDEVDQAVLHPRPVAAACVAAMGFLLAAQGQDGLWRDFRIINGASDEWVSGFVGWALAALPDTACLEALADARHALSRRQRANGGWGYNAASPADADSTAWVLRFFMAAGGDGDGFAQAFLLKHKLPDGGFTTYAPTTPIRFAEDMAGRGDAGWRANHDCVMANVANLPGTGLCDALRDRQRADGSWQAHWWRSDVFVTALAMDALAASVDPRPVKRALGWLRAQRPDSAFDRAWQALALRHGDKQDHATARALVVSLLAEQREDGSWASGAEMLFPAPWQQGRDGNATIYPDVRRNMTTASVLRALTIWS